MAKRVITKSGLRIEKGKKVEITRDTFVKNPRKGKKIEEVKARDKQEELEKSKIKKK